MKAHGLFRPGDNIALKVPSDEFAGTVGFYRDVLGLRVLEEDSGGSVIFDFGGKRLWNDPMPQFSQAEIWLEVITSDLDEAARHLTGVRLIPSVADAVQASVARTGERRVAVIPEGPYVVPVYRPGA
jgi:hypothetical protein